ncbi:hypothetical protein HDR66_03105 [bacterium]|nr:hypothetical protein [bacterium]
MSMVQDNRSVLTNSSKCATFVAIWNGFVEYLGDYLSGNKHKVLRRMNQEKQNTK